MLFPADDPYRATGPGALVWPAAPSCPGGAGPRVQAIVTGQPPGVAQPPGSPLEPTGDLSAAAATLGRIAIAGQDPRRPGRLLVVQGRAGSSFAPSLAGGALSAPAAMSTAYLGDLALLAPFPGGGLGVRIERWFGGGLQAQRNIATAGGGACDALTVALDFRSDAIAAWSQSGSVWVADLPQDRPAGPAVRLGPAGSHPQIAALLSDDDRAMVMWSQTTAATTSVWLDYSAAGPRFGKPSLVARFADPARSPPPGAPRLIRLSTESVMAAWPGTAGGHWVVRTAPIDQHGLRTVATIAAPGADVRLYALAPGPDGEAIALLGEPRPWPPAGITALPGQPTPTAPGAVSLLAARGTEVAGRTDFSAPEAVGEASSISGATLAVEPGTDRAVAAWQGTGGLVYWSLRDPG